ncbi:MAG: DegV family protein [Candidatus Heimdallarchaeota archaeon]|nr:DegV family protein [Candidatus Heimdallarchaeota archaeon]
MSKHTMKVIVDSTCDLPDDLAKKYDIDIVPVYVHHNDEIFADRIDITPTEFYDVLRNADELPKTSAPSPKDFLDKITANMKNSSSIFITTLSSKLSATFQSASIVAKRIKDKKIYLVDSKFGSGVLAFVSLAAAKLSRKGVPDEEIVKRVEKIRDESILLGYVDNLENLKKSGRISHIKYLIGSLIKSKPLLELTDGILQPIGQAKSKEKAINKVISSILDRIKKNQTYDVMITHGDDRETAETILQRLEGKFSIGEKIINYLTPALATHLGIGTIVVSLSPSPY